MGGGTVALLFLVIGDHVTAPVAHQLRCFLPLSAERDVLDAQLGFTHRPQHQQCIAQIERTSVDSQAQRTLGYRVPKLL